MPNREKVLIYFKILVFVFLNIHAVEVKSQSFDAFPYQGAVRSANNRPLANKAITVRISLRDSIASGTVVYRETHSLTTNSLGLFDLRVGQGTVVSGSFSAINWSGAAKFMQTEIDTGSGNFLDMGTTQLLSVPYALYAQNSGNGVPSGGTNGQVLTRCNGQLIWTTGGQCPGTLTDLNCASVTTTGTLTFGTAAIGVSNSIPYTGGNGGTHTGQTVTSTGVTGLTATLAAGTLAKGAGNLIYTITGTPSAAGTASFAISLGGQSCTLQTSVQTLQIGSNYGGGIIGYILQTGDYGFIDGEVHGLIISPVDQSNAANWGCNATLSIGTQTMLGYGLTNTNNIVLRCNEQGIAARLCYDLILNNYNDWFLPSIEELQKVYSNRLLVNTSLINNGGNPMINGAYWSSSEATTLDSWYLHFGGGNSSFYSKNSQYQVRAVRKF